LKKNICSKIPLFAKPYAERQFIVVVDDKLKEAENKAKQKATVTTEGKVIKWTKIVIKTLYSIVPATYLLVDAIETVLKSISKLRSKGIDVILVSRSDARNLIFSPGHPQDKVLYVGHPSNPPVYYPFSEFHRLLFEHKFSEALEMLMSLGATEVEVYRVKGWSSEFSLNLNIAISDWKPGIEAGKDKKASAKLLFKATLKSKKKPKLPKDLVWYPHELTWQKIAEGRIKYGLKDFALIIQYEDDFGINAGLKVKILKSGLDIGGKFEDHKKTAWRIVGKFGKAA